MRYYVIATVDGENKAVREVVRRLRFMTGGKARGRALVITEKDNEADEYGIFENGAHRKFVGELNQSQFDKLVSELDLSFEDVQTGGMLTYGGWLPAFSFRDGGYDRELINGAYVCPFPSTKREQKRYPAFDEVSSDISWNKIKEKLKARY